MERRWLRLVGWGVEWVILGALLWEHSRLCEFPCFLVLLAPILLFAHWVALREVKLAPGVRRRLVFVTGPCIFLSLSLVVSLNAELNHVAIVGGGTKEMTQAALKLHIPDDGWAQWHRDEIQRMKTERRHFTMILLMTCLLYGSRYAAAGCELKMMEPDSQLQ